MADAEGVPELDGAALRRARVAAQLLHRQARRSPAEIVRHLLATQAQEFRSVPLALRARSKGLTRADVHAALDSGEVVITWLNRGTLHLVCREDLPWLLEVTSAPVAVANRRRLVQEGVSEAGAEKGVRVVRKALADGPLRRAELRELLRSNDVAHTTQGAVHVLVAASLRGLIVRGPVDGREQTFALMEDHVGPLPKVDRDKALAELGRRYVAAHSPATAADLAYWAGIPLRDARRALTGVEQPQPVRIRSAPPRLLPAFDPYIMGWRERSFAIPPQHGRHVIPGGGMFRAVVVVDGRVLGTWTLRAGRAEVQLLDDDVEVALEAELADVQRFG